MRVQNIQNSYNTPFNAKLRVLGKFFVKEEYATLLKKADKIGFENDIVELNYTNYVDGSIEFFNQKRPLKGRFFMLLYTVYGYCYFGDESKRRCWKDDDCRESCLLFSKR